MRPRPRGLPTVSMFASPESVSSMEMAFLAMPPLMVPRFVVGVPDAASITRPAVPEPEHVDGGVEVHAVRHGSSLDALLVGRVFLGAACTARQEQQANGKSAHGLPQNDTASIEDKSFRIDHAVMVDR